MTGILQRLADDAAAPAPTAETGPPAAEPPPEPVFHPGGEGVSLMLTAVPGFQALMDLQKALIAVEQVASASVERFQEGDSRVLLQLHGPLTASDIVATLHHATGLHLVLEEARPELNSLHLKVLV
jgi:hypothetical protein